jgi:UDP-2-acetamido-2,6-beta-L-arabino-hexul-4-ose reductase
MKLLITGANGFIGRNLTAHLARREGVEILPCDISTPPAELKTFLSTCDGVFHLAGVNRPQQIDEFERGNAGFTEELCRSLETMGRKPFFIMTSSIQAEMDNPYGISKRHAEKALEGFSQRTGAPAVIYRLTNVFGKWCRPNYNSAVATFCHNIARDLPITVSDAAREVRLVYIDDVIAALLSYLDRPPVGLERRQSLPEYTITLGHLVETVQAFRASRQTLRLPDMADEFVRKLYATYLSYLETDGFAYSLEQRTDARGVLAEFVKQPHVGQMFVSRTHPGITRGNHYHHTKVEKFLVLEGEAVIRFRPIAGGEVVEYRMSGRDFKVVDIPPGYTHAIENVGPTEMIVLFWASEVFDPSAPDTYALNVKGELE